MAFPPITPSGPRRPRAACRRPGCAGTVRDGICSQCGPRRRRRDRQYDRERGSAASRGYDAEWRKLRAAFLANNPLCVHCLANGTYMLANEVDHIQPLRAGGTNEWGNLQALCKSCHSSKTAREGGI